jgi:hypothetical protein
MPSRAKPILCHVLEGQEGEATMSDPGTSIHGNFTPIERNPFIKPGGQPQEKSPTPLEQAPETSASSYQTSREAGTTPPSGQETSTIASFSSAWRSALRGDGATVTEKDHSPAEHDPESPDVKKEEGKTAPPLFSRQQAGRIDKTLGREEKMQDNLHTEAENLTDEKKKGIQNFMERTMQSIDRLRNPVALPQMPAMPRRASGAAKPAQPQARDRSGRKSSDEVNNFEDQVQHDMGRNVEVVNRGEIDSLNGDVPSLKELNTFFEKAKKDPTLPWGYLEDGCYSRAHETCRQLMDKGYNCSKLFAYMDDNDFSDPSKRLHGANQYSKGEWQYHVAPLVFARDERTGAVDGYLVDPSTHPEGPVKASQWLKGMWNGNSHLYLDVAQPDVVHARPPGSTSGPEVFSRQKFDEFMPEAAAANRDFADVLEFIKEKANRR